MPERGRCKRKHRPGQVPARGRSWGSRTVAGASPSERLLNAQGQLDWLGHVDLAARLRGLGGLDATTQDGLADQDLTALEVDVLPPQPVDLGGAQSGEEAQVS